MALNVAHYGAMANSAAPAVEEHAAEVVPSGSGRLLSRHEAARALGVSETTLRRLAVDGLRPIVQGRRHLYEETVVQEAVRTKSVRRRWTEMPPTTDGGVAADVFALIDDGVSPREVVKRLRVSPELVAKLLTQWASLGSGVYLPGEMAKDLGVATPADILAKLANATKRENDAALAGPQCCNCRVKAAAYCPECARGEGEP